MLFLTAILLAQCTASLADAAQDALIGNGTAGPYTLSWKQIITDTENVQINQLPQMRGLDYTLDPDSGTITFAHPLAAHSAASVRYVYDPAHALRTNVVTQVPLSFDLAQTANSHVFFHALYRSAGTSSASVPGVLTLGIGSGWQAGQSQFSTQLLFAPPAAGQGKTDASHLGIAVSGSGLAARGVQLSGSFARAGAYMTTPDDSRLTAGVQTLMLGTELSPSHQVQAAVNWALSAPTSAADGHAQTHTDASVSITPARTLQLQTRWSSTTDGGSAPTQNTAVSLSAQPTAAANISASFAANTSADVKADAQTLHLAAALAPMQIVHMSAEMGQTHDASGLASTQQVSLALTPWDALHLHTGVALRQTETAQTTVATVEGQVQPVSYLQFAASYRNRTASPSDTTVTDTLNTSTAHLTLSPLRGLRVIGSYAQNPDDTGDTPQRLARRGLGLETNVGALSVSGGYDWQRGYDTLAIGTTLRVGIGLRLSGATRFDGSYKQTLSGIGVSPAGTSFYTFGLSHMLGDRFSLAMSGTLQNPLGPAVTATPDYTANASLGLKF